MGEAMVTGAAGGIGQAVVAALVAAAELTRLTLPAQRCIQPQTLAATVARVLAAPPDAYVSELSVLATPRGN